MRDFYLDSSGVALDDDPADTIAAEPETKSAISEQLDRAAETIKRFGETQPLYFDLETIPDYDRLDSFDLPPVPTVPNETDLSQLPDPKQVATGTVDTIKATLRRFVAPRSWLEQVTEAERAGKDRSGVHQLIEAARNVRQEAIAAQADRNKLLSTTPEYCKVAAIGWARGNDAIQSIVLDEDNGELRILSVFWQLAAVLNPLIAFNGISFDLPVIFIRSALLGIASSRSIDMKAWGRDVVDPYYLRFGSRGAGNGRPGKLKQLARLHGIAVPAGDVDGGCVDQLIKTDPAKVGEYVRSDVHVLREYHRALAGYFWS